MLSLYQRELQDNVKYYKDFEDNLRKCGWKPDEDSPHETLEDFIKWMYDYDEKRIKERFNKNTDQKKYKWIGINPCPLMEDLEEVKIKLKELYNVLKSKCITSSWLQDSYFVVEAFTNNGLRPHIHMIVVSNVRPSRMIDQFSKWFKCEKNMIEVNSMNFGYEDKMNYLKGIKTESKQEFVINDRNMREELNIPHIYPTP